MGCVAVRDHLEPRDRGVLVTVAIICVVRQGMVQQQQRNAVVAFWLLLLVLLGLLCCWLLVVVGTPIFVPVYASVHFVHMRSLPHVFQRYLTVARI